MKQLITVLSVWLVATLSICFTAQDMFCGGKERWSVKILADKKASSIDTNAIVTTVDRMINLKRPTILLQDKRDSKECKTYQIDCKIREYKEEDDGDYHLVLMDLKDTTKTIIGEIADYSCPRVASSTFFKYFLDSRSEFEINISKGNRVKYAVYRITGVCFFDKIHGQLGVAPNGIELHPIIKFQKLK
jgi:hypothetical protein